jgi:hypothetical protein
MPTSSLPNHLLAYREELLQHPLFRALLSGLDRPQIPLWRPSSGNDPVEWAYQSGRRDGFDAVFIFLGLKPEETKKD